MNILDAITELDQAISRETGDQTSNIRIVLSDKAFYSVAGQLQKQIPFYFPTPSESPIKYDFQLDGHRFVPHVTLSANQRTITIFSEKPIDTRCE